MFDLYLYVLDTVGVELLPENEWCAPQRNLVLRDLEEATLKADDDENDENCTFTSLLY